MKLMGIGDEAGAAIDAQIDATLALGWKHIEMRAVEVPGFPKANFHDIPDAAFDIAAGKLAAAGLEVHCFGSTVMNWGKKVEDPFEITLAEVRRTIPRMQRLGAKFVRIMSFKPDDHADKIPDDVFRRVNEVTRMFLDAGIQPLHENCMNHGGMSWRHALELLEKCPGLQWLFDTANPVFNPDRSTSQPWPRQDPWEFWTHVRDHVVHIHIKDATWNPARNDADYHWPGEGDGRVRDVLRDAFSRGYDAGISIESHMVAVFHEQDANRSDEALKANFVEYGQRVENLIKNLDRN
ncbi:MAG: sugar phosphate isomerase/epimerase family protein [Chthoniobacterales bacterium]